MSKRWCWSLAAFGIASLGLACAKAPEQSAPADAAAPASAELEQELEAPAAEPAPAEEREAEAAAPGLEQLQRELAGKSSRLRALGVEMPTRIKEGADAAPSEPAREESLEPPVTTKKEQRKRKGKGKKNNEAGGGKPSKQPSAKPAGPDRLDDIAGGGGVAPDEAKSVRLSPEGEPEEASACAQICALSQGTCELRGAICELAERHDDEPDYSSACERAEQDCVVAEEACRACSE